MLVGFKERFGLGFVKQGMLQKGGWLEYFFCKIWDLIYLWIIVKLLLFEDVLYIIYFDNYNYDL